MTVLDMPRVTERARGILDAAELLPGYWRHPDTGAWCSLPWPGDPSLPLAHPTRLALLPPSLGPNLIRFAETHFIHHLTGGPWRFTAGQKRFLHLWYAVRPVLGRDGRPVAGRWVYRSAVKRGAKGTGKDPFMGVMGNLELLADVRFDHWEDQRVPPSAHHPDGIRWVPVGAAHQMPLVQIAANSEAQAADVLRVANAILPRATRELFGIDTGATRTTLDNGGRMELLTASQKTAEGDPATHIGLNESHHMTESSGGHKVAEVARRNVGKSPAWLQARLVEYTNAHQMGSDSVAERSYDAWQAQVAGRSKRADILYDSFEAAPTWDLYDDEVRHAGLVQAYTDAPWADLERLGDEVLDPRTSVADSIRFYGNGLAAAEDAWCDPSRFDALAAPEAEVHDGEAIALFLDCSKSSDATGLVGCRLSDGHVFTLGVWQRPHGDRGTGWLAPRAEVDAVVRDTESRFNLAWFGVDPSPARDDADEALYWQSLIDAWHRDFRSKVTVWATPGGGEFAGNAVLFDMRLSAKGGALRNQAFTEMAMATAKDIDGEDETAPVAAGTARAFTHDGHPALRTHVHNAKRRPNQWGYTLGKVTRDSGHLVDLAVCMVGARLGRRLVLNSGKTTEKKKGGRIW